ncbi:MAG: hypothetical protein MHM6MM_005310 [Cercozoa sp. M6MM]
MKAELPRATSAVAQGALSAMCTNTQFACVIANRENIGAAMAMSTPIASISRRISCECVAIFNST